MKIVVAYDGSDPARRALDRAAELAGERDKLVVVAAAEPHPVAGLEAGAFVEPSEVARRRDDLEEAQRLLSERGIEAEPVEGEGDPGAFIVNAAKDADLIVVGSRGLSPAQRILLGSVSSKVVHRAHCDVLVVR
jgi:nucleotide-binding universal stress UspA family protein